MRKLGGSGNGNPMKEKNRLGRKQNKLKEGESRGGVIFCFDLRIGQGQNYGNFEVVHCRTDAVFPSDSSLVCGCLREQKFLWPSQ